MSHNQNSQIPDNRRHIGKTPRIPYFDHDSNFAAYESYDCVSVSRVEHVALL